jgi:hypothetical protein
VASFSQDITAFVKKTKVRTDVVLRKIAFDCFAGVLMRSPVKTGRFRGSWRIGINKVDLSVQKLKDTKGKPAPVGTPPSADQVAAANVKLGSAQWGHEIHISNNLPYAQRLEEGWSKQAPGPGGIMAASLAKVVAEFRQVVEKVKGEVP